MLYGIPFPLMQQKIISSKETEWKAKFQLLFIIEKHMFGNVYTIKLSHLSTLNRNRHTYIPLGLKDKS